MIGSRHRFRRYLVFVQLFVLRLQRVVIALQLTGPFLFVLQLTGQLRLSRMRSSQQVGITLLQDDKVLVGNCVVMIFSVVDGRLFVQSLVTGGDVLLQKLAIPCQLLHEEFHGFISLVDLNPV